MPQMTDSEYREFPTRGTRTAKLATTHADGRPHVVTSKESVKGRSIRRVHERAEERRFADRAKVAALRNIAARNGALIADSVPERFPSLLAAAI